MGIRYFPGMQRVALAATILCAASLAACGGDQQAGSAGGTAAGTANGSVASSTSGADLTGAGATFPYPIYSKWFADYAVKTGVKINYQSIGSGGGVRQISEMTVDFGASDGPMSDQEIAGAKGGPILHIPTVLGADVVTYNLPGVTQALKFTPDVIAGIFLGKIVKWNDPKIAATNPGVKFPDQSILVVHRSDGSGTTYIWTDYLSSVSPEWAKGPGRGKDVQWPAGIGGKGNEGVAGQVKQTPYSIGYIELAYARQNKLPYALVRNSAGKFVEPTIESVTAAAAGVAQKLPPNTDYRVSIVNGPGADGYPISSFTWLLVYKNQRDPTKGKKLVDFIKWALHDGQKEVSALDYAPLPDAIVAPLNARVDSIRVGPAA
jgi:phosphate transport system substrate-binding protein